MTAGDKVQFAGDFDVVTATKTSAPATPSTAPSSPPTIPAQPPLVPTFSTYSSSLVELKVTIDAVSKSLTKICRASLDKCVWDFGQDVGTAMLSSPVSHGFVFSYAGHHWRSRQHPNLTLAEAGVRKSGEAVAFSADVRPLSPAEASPAVELTATGIDLAEFCRVCMPDSDMKRCFFPHPRCGVVLKSAITPRPLRLPPGVPNPTDYRETPWSAQSQQTTVRLTGVPNPTDYRETTWSAQPHRLP